MFECVIIDTETTGIGNSAQVIELGYIGLPDLQELKRTSPIYGRTFPFYSKRYKPTVPIQAEAQAVHGISMEMLTDCDSVTSIELPESKFILGHSVAFDHNMLGRPDRKLICTLQLAKKLWKKEEVGNHKLANLIEKLIPEGKDIIGEAHGALADCYLTLILLNKILELMPRAMEWEDLIMTTPTPKQSMAKKPITAMPFGKHKGEALSSVPRPYLEWALANLELKADLKEAIEKELFVSGKTPNRF